MTCRDAFGAIARSCRDDLLANQAAACQGDPEALHQMRIALTRLRTARSFFSPFMSSAEWSHLRGELKWLNKHLSKVRDLDVALKRLPPDETSGQRPQSLGRIWQKTWDASHRQLKRAIISRRYRTLTHDISVWIENETQSPVHPQQPTSRHSPSLTTYAVRRLHRWHKKLLKMSDTIEEMNASQRHQLRIRSKRLRYAIEFFGSLFSGQDMSKLKALLKSLRKIQKCLGHLNDAEQGRSIAINLAAVDRNNGARWHSLFQTDRKTLRRLIKTVTLAFRQMEELKLDR